MLIYLQLIETAEDRSKFEMIYLSYKDAMYHIAYKILKHPEDAEDTVHQAFVKVAENISKISEPVCPKTSRYIVIITETTAIDMLRKKTRHPIYSLDEASGISVEYEGENVLAAHILQLPDKQRKVLWLKYYHGYTSHEIAKILNITYASVIKIDQRAKRKLQEVFEKEGEQIK